MLPAQAQVDALAQINPSAMPAQRPGITSSGSSRTAETHRMSARQWIGDEQPLVARKPARFSAGARDRRVTKPPLPNSRPECRRQNIGHGGRPDARQQPLARRSRMHGASRTGPAPRPSAPWKAGENEDSEQCPIIMPATTVETLPRPRHGGAPAAHRRPANPSRPASDDRATGMSNASGPLP